MNAFDDVLTARLADARDLVAAILAELEEQPSAVTSPIPGVALMMCRCGSVLDLADMCFDEVGPGWPWAAVRPIVCPGCAAASRWQVAA